MAAVATPTAKVEGVTNNGKRSAEATFVAPVNTNTQTAAGMGLTRIDEVWLRVDGTALIAAIAAGGVTSITWLGTGEAGRWKFVGS